MAQRTAPIADKPNSDFCAMTSHSVISGIEVVAGVFAALTAVRMRRSGLHRRYRFLFAYLLFQVPYSIPPATMSLGSRGYFWFWLISEPINWMFEILVVRELCGLVLERYRGLCSLGRWSMYGGVALSAAISLATLLPRIPSAVTRRSMLLSYYFGGDRGVNLALAIFLLLMMFLASRYPVPLNRNVVLNAVMFTVLFFGNTLASLLRTIFDLRVAVVMDVGLTASTALSLIVWFFAFTPGGETNRLELAHFRPEDEARILQRLDRINRLMLRLASHMYGTGGNPGLDRVG
jgi:hypothetical protein